MSGFGEVMTVAIAALFIIGVLSCSVIIQQYRTIDRLTNKLMARDYREYKAIGGGLMEEEKTLRKPLSYYDDPLIEDEA